MNDKRSSSAVFCLLGFAVFARFVAIVGIEVQKIAPLLAAYAATEARFTVFAIQFAAIIISFFMIKDQAELALKVTILFCLVSLARFFVPIFIVSVFGDLLVTSIVFFGTRTRGGATKP